MELRGSAGTSLEGVEAQCRLQTQRGRATSTGECTRDRMTGKKPNRAELFVQNAYNIFMRQEKHKKRLTPGDYCSKGILTIPSLLEPLQVASLAAEASNPTETC